MSVPKGALFCIYFLFLLSVIAMGLTYFFWHRYWSNHDPLWKNYSGLPKPYHHYIFCSLGLPFLPSLASCLFKMMPMVKTRTLEYIHSIITLIGLIFVIYGLFAIYQMHYYTVQKSDSRLMHTSFGLAAFIMFALMMIISPYLFLPPYFSQLVKRHFLGVHSLFGCFTVVLGCMAVMTAFPSNFNAPTISEEARYRVQRVCAKNTTSVFDDYGEDVFAMIREDVFLKNKPDLNYANICVFLFFTFQFLIMATPGWEFKEVGDI